MFTWKGEMMCGRVHTIDKQDTREVNWVKEWAKEHWNQTDPNWTEPFISHCRTFFTFSFSYIFFFMYDLRACICAPSLFCCLIFNRKKNEWFNFIWMWSRTRNSFTLCIFLWHFSLRSFFLHSEIVRCCVCMYVWYFWALFSSHCGFLIMSNMSS